jgi:hypothetical protein
MEQPEGTNFDLIAQLVGKHLEVICVTRMALSAGAQAPVPNNFSLIDIAMDLIGFPPHEVYNRDRWYELELDRMPLEVIVMELRVYYVILKHRRPELFIK